MWAGAGLLFLVLIALSLRTSPVSAVYNYTPLEAVPNTTCTGDSKACFKSYITGIYNFFIGTAGIAAMGLIIWGGIQYFFSAGNVAKAGDGKEMISNALFGLFIVMVSYLILYVVNPDLVTFDLDNFTKVEVCGTQSPCTQ